MTKAEQFIDNIKNILKHDDSINIILSRLNIERLIITKSALLEIYNFIIEQEDKLDLINIINNFKTNDYLFLSRKKYPIQRTCIILYNKDNILELILTPNSKYYDLDGKTVKDKTINIESINKKINFAFKIDNPYLSNIKLIKKRLIINDNEYILSIFNNVLEIEKKFSNPNYCLTHTAKIEVKNNNQLNKVYLFYTCAINDLFNIITGNNNNYIKICKTQSFIKHLLEGLCYMHAQKIIHADIKLENVLLQDNLLPAYIDFELSIDTETNTLNNKYGGTISALSPQLLYHIGKVRTNIYHDNKSEIHYSLHLMQKYPNIIDINKKDPDYSDDCWALGVLLFSMITGKSIQYTPYSNFIINNNPILTGLLNPNYKLRFTAKQAYECWQNHSSFIFYSFEDLCCELQHKIIYNIDLFDMYLFRNELNQAQITINKIELMYNELIHKKPKALLFHYDQNRTNLLKQKITEQININHITTLYNSLYSYIVTTAISSNIDETIINNITEIFRAQFNNNHNKINEANTHTILSIIDKCIQNIKKPFDLLNDTNNNNKNILDEFNQSLSKFFNDSKQENQLQSTYKPKDM